MNVLESNVLPWLFDKVETFVDELTVQGDFSDILVGANVNAELGEHERTVQAERDRKQAAKRAVEEAAARKLEEKRARKDARQLAAKAAGLKKFKEELQAKFVHKGEAKDSVLS